MEKIYKKIVRTGELSSLGWNYSYSSAMKRNSLLVALVLFINYEKFGNKSHDWNSFCLKYLVQSRLRLSVEYIVVVSDQSVIWGIEPYVGQSASSRVKLFMNS